MPRFVIVCRAICVALVATVAIAQTNNHTLTKSTRAVGYQVGGSSTQVDFKPTQLLASAAGQATVKATQGKTQVDAKFKGLQQPTKFGAEFLTYVLWAVSPDGRAANLGEILTERDGDGRLNVSTPLQTFSLIVTAEPFFAVRMPSELIVLENEIRSNTKGRIFMVNEYTLMRRAQYQKIENPLALTLDLKAQPLEMYEARNAVAIARSNDAEKYAPEIYTKAAASLQMAENELRRNKDRKALLSTARQCVQFSQDALTLAVQRQEEERLANERAAREAAERRAQAQAQAEAQRRAQAEVEKARAEAESARAQAAQAKAELEQQEARRKAQEEAKLRSEAEAASAKALEAQRGAEEAAAQLRAKLLEQFNKVLDTRDTDRGLVVNMSDVLFDTGKYTLRSEAREKLARIAGIIVNYPKLTLEAEGHTDNVGSLEFNQRLSEQRAQSVREYLVLQGVPESSITASGKAFNVPIATNDTAAGRQKNRRVELIVSGEVIGTRVGTMD